MTATKTSTQKEILLAALRAAPLAGAAHPAGPGKWLPVSAIMRLGIAQFGARISELRDQLAASGETIENFWCWDDHTQGRLSWYRIARVSGLDESNPDRKKAEREKDAEKEAQAAGVKS